MEPIIDIGQFKRACHFHQFGSMVIGGIALVQMFVGMGVYAAFKAPLSNVFVPVLTQENAEGVVMGLCLLPSIVFLFGGLFWLELKSKSSVNATCHRCKKFLAGMMHLVIATKHCHCGRRVLSDPID